MAVSTIAYTDEMVGAGHPTKADTLNKLALIEHDTEGKHGSTAWAAIFSGEPSTVTPYELHHAGGIGTC